MRALLFLSLFGLLFLTGCGQKSVGVFDAAGKEVGSLFMQGETAEVRYGGNAIGKIESGTFLSMSGKKVGAVKLSNERVVIEDARGNPVGSVEAGTNCFGKTPAAIGRIGEALPSDVAAGGCYLLLLARAGR